MMLNFLRIYQNFSIIADDIGIAPSSNPPTDFAPYSFTAFSNNKSPIRVSPLEFIKIFGSVGSPVVLFRCWESVGDSIKLNSRLNFLALSFFSSLILHQ
jgi:hypothetical protein